MHPVTPSPRRGAFRSLSDLQSLRDDDSAGGDGGANTKNTKNGEDASLAMAIPLPPLYYKKREDIIDTEKNKNTILSSSFHHYKTPEKSNKPNLSIGKHGASAFLPIERGAPWLSRSTPPLSPLIAKQLSYESPSSATVSLAPTEDITEGSWTPGGMLGTPLQSPTVVSHASSPPPFAPPFYPQSVVRMSSSSSSPHSQLRSPPPLSSSSSAAGHNASASSFIPVTPRNNHNKKQYRRPSPYSPANSSLGSITSVATPSTPTSTNSPNKNHQRLKTELCMHWSKGTEACPFGEYCTYAHGEEELQITKLLDFQRLGLIEDAETYRTKPCLTWVATGSCPFGRRCACLHDPRVAGGRDSSISWLPHTETQGNTMTTDVFVDALHQKRLGTCLYDNPFGADHSLDMDGFADLYQLICNINTTNSKRRRTSGISEAHKIAIALKMRENHTWTYKYRPQHVIFGENCMVLEKRAFFLEKSGLAVPIAISKFDPHRKEHVLIREIAFGPDCDTSVRGVALWFNIPDYDISTWSPLQAKKYRWKKKPKNSPDHPHRKTSPFDGRESFKMVRPTDPVAFDFVTKVLMHRFDTLQAKRLPSLSERSKALKSLGIKEAELKKLYDNLKHSWIQWAWPNNEGRGEIDRDTLVPPVDGTYKPEMDQESLAVALLSNACEQQNDDRPVKGFYTQAIWASFVSQRFKHTDRSRSDSMTSARRSSRLETFLDLANGNEVATDRSLPHILSMSHRTTPQKEAHQKSGLKSIPQSRQSEICWKALLLKRSSGGEEEAGDFQPKNHEWDMVREHFQKSRSRNTLTIVQNN